jgi:hypothetical protein
MLLNLPDRTISSLDHLTIASELIPLWSETDYMERQLFNALLVKQKSVEFLHKNQTMTFENFSKGFTTEFFDIISNEFSKCPSGLLQIPD